MSKKHQRQVARKKASFLKGKVIKKAEPRLFDTEGYVAGFAHDWKITFTDGSFLTLNVEETETGEYGCDIAVFDKDGEQVTVHEKDEDAVALTYQPE